MVVAIIDIAVGPGGGFDGPGGLSMNPGSEPVLLDLEKLFLLSDE